MVKWHHLTFVDHLLVYWKVYTMSRRYSEAFALFKASRYVTAILLIVEQTQIVYYFKFLFVQYSTAVEALFKVSISVIVTFAATTDWIRTQIIQDFKIYFCAILIL